MLSQSSEERTLETCPKSCLELYKPVCGSDKQIYLNECYLKQKNCKNDVKLVPMNHCAVTPRYTIPILMRNKISFYNWIFFFNFIAVVRVWDFIYLFNDLFQIIFISNRILYSSLWSGLWVNNSFISIFIHIIIDLICFSKQFWWKSISKSL